MLSRFHRIPERNGRTDSQTDTDRFALSISRVSVLTRDSKTVLYLQGNDTRRSFNGKRMFFLFSFKSNKSAVFDQTRQQARRRVTSRTHQLRLT